MKMQTIAEKLSSILGQSVQHLEDILDNLHQERQAMIRAEHDMLLKLVEAKTLKIDILADLDAVMTEILSQCNPQASMTEFLLGFEAQPGHESLQVLWEYYVALLRACRDKNTINSNVVNLRLQRLRFEYQMVTGKQQQNPAAYDARGQIQTVTEADPETVV